MLAKTQPTPSAQVLLQHPLASAFLAILWATLLVGLVAGLTTLRAGEVQAMEPGGAPSSPDAVPALDTP